MLLRIPFENWAIYDQVLDPVVEAETIKRYPDVSPLSELFVVQREVIRQEVLRKLDFWLQARTVATILFDLDAMTAEVVPFAKMA